MSRLRSKSCTESGLAAEFAEFGNPADLDPFDDEDVAGMVEAGAVRGDELAGGELGARAFAEVHPIAGGVFAEVGDDLVAGAEQGDTGREVRDDHDAVLFVEMAGEVDAGVERLVGENLVAGRPCLSSL